MKIHLKTVDLAGLVGFEPTNTEVKAPDVDRFITTQKQFHLFSIYSSYFTPRLSSRDLRSHLHIHTSDDIYSTIATSNMKLFLFQIPSIKSIW